MELPHMGQHCSDSFCKQLDYLPMKCDACSQLFCKDHLQYDDHKCTSLYKKNIQVPVCPLCNTPIPVERGAVPDLAVSAHIEENCHMKKKDKVFTNKCNKPKCKKKELVACICDKCHLNFCLTHRHTADHDCKGPQKSNQPTSKAAAAAAARAGGSSSNNSSGQSKISNFFTGPFKTEQTRPTQPSASAAAAINRQSGRGTTPGRPCLVPSNPNAGMSEDEALAAALAASMADSSLQSNDVPGQNLTSEEEDRMLAQALQESERLARQQGQGQAAGGERDKNCSLQ